MTEEDKDTAAKLAAQDFSTIVEASHKDGFSILGYDDSSLDQLPEGDGDRLLISFVIGIAAFSPRAGHARPRRHGVK